MVTLTYTDIASKAKMFSILFPRHAPPALADNIPLPSAAMIALQIVRWQLYFIISRLALPHPSPPWLDYLKTILYGEVISLNETNKYNFHKSRLVLILNLKSQKFDRIPKSFKSNLY